MTKIDRRTFILGGAALGASTLVGHTLSGCSDASNQDADSQDAATSDDKLQNESPDKAQDERPQSADISSVYFTTDISPEGLLSIYDALGVVLADKVAVKVSTGEPGGHNYLQPSLIGALVQQLSGTIVECNTAYGGSRSSSAQHYQVAADHGFTAIADVDIMDEEGETSLPVSSGRHLSENLVGSHFERYASCLSLAHFKGHAMGGFGGAIKNISIGIASSSGKSLIHSGGTQTTGFGSGTPQDTFLESMAEAAKTIQDLLGDNICYINVMNRLSIDCDCDSNPAEPDMADIGILASIDPVAVDQACVDLVYAASDGQSLIERIESRNGVHMLDYAASIGLGKKEYELISLD